MLYSPFPVASAVVSKPFPSSAIVKSRSLSRLLGCHYYFGASRLPYHVINSLFEYQVHLLSAFYAHRYSIHALLEVVDIVHVFASNSGEANCLILKSICSKESLRGFSPKMMSSIFSIITFELLLTSCCIALLLVSFSSLLITSLSIDMDDNVEPISSCSSIAIRARSSSFAL